MYIQEELCLRYLGFTFSLGLKPSIVELYLGVEIN